ncbi:MAG: substrate-binding domain-containing protein [Gammaproteobacteria bacterium]|nr:substrate-binding domain-containing protein [Gammaproteobacteria bacterium]
MTLADVAAAANVSPATVSRALNQPELVRPEVLERIQEKISTIGYVPHGPARTLASRRSRTFGAIVPSLKWAFFADTIDAFQSQLEQSGYVMLLTTSEYDPKRELLRARALIERGVDGLMLVGHKRPSELYELLLRSRIPFINAWATRRDTPYPAVGIDHTAAGEMSARHLLSLGHRDIAVIIGQPEGNDRVQGRLAGVRRALKTCGVELRPERLIYKDYTIDAARQGLRELLAHGDAPTAVFCGNDVLACGVLFECQRLGIAVPEQLSILGFGDNEIARETVPALTTLRGARAEIGRLAAEYLLARVDGMEIELPEVLDMELIVRGSTAPPRAQQAPVVVSGR